MASTTEAALAYTAGIIDGEGCISIRRKPYHLSVIVVSADSPLTDWLRGQWGGSVGIVRRKQAYGPGEYHRWVIASRQGADLLKRCLPYFRIKGDQARVAIGFQALASHSKRHRLRDMGDTYEPYYLRLRALKRRRAAAETKRLDIILSDAELDKALNDAYEEMMKR